MSGPPIAEANRARRMMEVAKARIRAGGPDAAVALLERPTQGAARMRVYRFLTAVPLIGDVRALRITLEAGLPPSALQKRIGPYRTVRRGESGCLTTRQRRALAAVVASVGKSKAAR